MSKSKGAKTRFIKQRLGVWKESPWDSRHFRVNPISSVIAGTFPEEEIDLLGYAPTEIWPDQGNIGTCVGWDGSVVMEITNTLLYEYANRTNNMNLLRYIITDLSAGWLYHWSRKYGGVPDYVEGSTNIGLMKALNHVGTALEVSVPTDTVAPWDGISYDPDVEEAAKEYAIDSYYNVNPNPNDIKAAILGITHPAPYLMPDDSPGKIPLVSAYPVYETYQEGYDDGIVPNPQPGEKLLGGHSSAIIGWKKIDDKEYFINLNSWGTDVGDGGLFYLPIDYPFYSKDWWLVHNGPPIPNGDIDSTCPIANGIAWMINGVFSITGSHARMKVISRR